MASTSWGAGRKQTLTIPSSGTESDILDLGSAGTLDAYHIGVLVPAGLTGIVGLTVSDSDDGPFKSLQSNGTDVAFVANKAAVLSPVPFRYIRFESDSAEAADRDFVVQAFSQ